MKKDKTNNNYNVITVGDSGVGKTSIICRYTQNKFYEHVLSTMGMAKTARVLTLKKGQKITLFLNDTAGQEKFNSLSKQYFNNADGALFVFDLNNKTSFRNIKTWITFANDNKNIGNDFPKYLVGNKKDLERKIDKDEIEIFLEENKDYKYYEISAKDDNDNQINELFQEMGEELFTFASKRKNSNKKKKSKVLGYKEEKPSTCKKCIV